MIVMFNQAKANEEKKPDEFQDFKYDKESNGGCVNKFDEISKLILTISNDVENLGNEYTALQGKYDKFTKFNDSMNSNKASLRSSIDNIKREFDKTLDMLAQVLAALTKNDTVFISDLESINKLISNEREQNLQTRDLRNKNDGTAPSERPDAPKDGTNEAGYVPTGADEHSGTYNGPVLNSSNGRIQGPSGEETYYNLDMSKIVAESQPGGWVYNDAKAHGNEGNLSSNYWVREDGCKMMGDYVMVAADLNVHPRGSIVQTSLGPGIVVDTGDFAKTNHNQFDIATTW